MPRVDPIQESFSAGELSPLSWGVISAERYRQGLARCLNYIPTLQGPAVRRTGTKYVGRAKYPDRVTIFIPFEFNRTQSYILEFGDGYIRFWTNYGQVTNTAQNITAITNANPCVITYSGSDTYSSGDEVFIEGLAGTIGNFLNGRNFKLANVNTGANTAELQDLDGNPIDSTAFGAYTSGGTIAEIYEVTSLPYLESELSELRWEQSADVLYLVHPDRGPRVLARLGATNWVMFEVSPTDGPYLSINSTTTTLTSSDGTEGASNTITASGVTGINGNQGFLSTDVGRLIRIKHGSSWVPVVIQTVNSTTSVDVVNEVDLGGTTATRNWRLGAWSDTDGYPTAVCFHEDRLCFTGAGAVPLQVDGSATGAYTDFAPSDADGTVTDSHAISFTVNQRDVNPNEWLFSEEHGLIAGSYKGESVIRAATEGAALSPTNVVAKGTTSYGSSPAQAISAGKNIIHVQKSGRRVRELIYREEILGFSSVDLTENAYHLTTDGIEQITFQQDPHSLVWARKLDGRLLAASYDRDLDRLRIGWSEHVLGGSGDGQDGAPIVTSMAVIPSPDGFNDDLWLLVERTIDGEVVQTVEYLSSAFDEADELEDAYFLDCGLTYDGSPATTITGLWHLEGETVSIFADGLSVADQTVTNGSITLATAASKVHIGYSYQSDLKLLPFQVGSARGTALGKIRRTHGVGFYLHRTLGLKFGYSFDALDEMDFRTSDVAANEPPELFSGVRVESVDADYERTNQLCIRQDGPYPGIVVSIAPYMDLQDG